MVGHVNPEPARAFFASHSVNIPILPVTLLTFASKTELCPATYIFLISTYIGCNRLMYNLDHRSLDIDGKTSKGPSYAAHGPYIVQVS